MSEIIKSFITSETEKRFCDDVMVHRKIHETKNGDLFEEKTGESVGFLVKISNEEAQELSGEWSLSWGFASNNP